MSIIQEVITTITSWVTGFMGAILDVIEGLVPVFYNEEGGLTVLGVLGLMGISIGLVRFGINFVQRFFLK
ncbi:MAG: hypothetical protein QXI16_06585 [Sulfolobaceae archaeon]